MYYIYILDIIYIYYYSYISALLLHSATRPHASAGCYNIYITCIYIHI